MKWNWKIEKVESVLFPLPLPQMYENTIWKLQSKLFSNVMSSNRQVDLFVSFKVILLLNTHFV